MGIIFVLRDDVDGGWRFLDFCHGGLYHVYRKVLQVLQAGDSLTEQSVRLGIQTDG